MACACWVDDAKNEFDRATTIIPADEQFGNSEQLADKEAEEND